MAFFVGESRSRAGEALASRSYAVATVRAVHRRILQATTAEQTHVLLLEAKTLLWPTITATVGVGDIRADYARRGTAGRGRLADGNDPHAATHLLRIANQLLAHRGEGGVVLTLGFSGRILIAVESVDGRRGSPIYHSIPCRRGPILDRNAV
jgi:hypothetical protein